MSGGQGNQYYSFQGRDPHDENYYRSAQPAQQRYHGFPLMQEHGVRSNTSYTPYMAQHEMPLASSSIPPLQTQSTWADYNQMNNSIGAGLLPSTLTTQGTAQYPYQTDLVHHSSSWYHSQGGVLQTQPYSTRPTGHGEVFTHDPGMSILSNPNDLRTPSPQTNHICDECSKNFSFPSALCRHKREKHTNKKHKCAHCDVRLTRPESLKRHIERRHKPER